MRRLVLLSLAALVLAVPPAAAESPAEPYLVKDIDEWAVGREHPGCTVSAGCSTIEGSLPSHLTAVGNRVFFLAFDHSRGRNLWVSDGTAEGTRLAVDLELNGWEPAELIGAAGDRLVYRSIGLWATDGTPEGTRQLAPHQYPLALHPQWPLRAGTTAAVGDLLYFAYDRGFSQPSWLWRTDGTPEGTFPVELPVTVLRAAAVDGALILAVRQTSDGFPVPPTLLWRLTADGETSELARGCGAGVLDRDMTGLAGFGGDVVFYARCVEGAGQGQGPSLFTVPAAGGAATLVADRVETWNQPLASRWEVGLLLEPRPPSVVAPPAVAGERLVFGRSGSAGDELWSYGGGELRLEAGGLPGELLRVAAVGERPLVVVGPDAEWHGVADGALVPLGAIDGGVVGVATPDAFYAPAAQGGIARLDGTAEGSDVVLAEAFAGWFSFGGAGDRVYFEAVDAHGHELWALPVTAPSPHGCVEDDVSLCLAGERFAVSVTWRDPRSGDTGAGVAVGETADSGFFWFFDPANLEVLVKVLDATTVNGHHWVFHGSLTDVEYEVRVEDLATGAVRTYHRPAGSLCGGADTAAFPADGAAAGAAGAPLRTAPGGASSAASLTLGPGGRFTVDVEWLDAQAGVFRPATLVEKTADSAWAWFFDPANVEVFLKVIDARVLDGHFWVFHGGLTDVAYRLTVTDGATGAQRVYEKPAGSFCGGADTAAF
jgi:ELWxxDGT repeat protein